MVVSLQSTAKAEQNSTKLVSVAASTEFVQGDNAEFRLKLNNTLQSSLELGQVLQLFLENIQPELKLAGLAYVNEDQAIDIKLGKQTTHSCGYQLITPDENLGEITFTRRKRFNEADLETIESLLTSLLNPLRNALKYRDAIRAALKDPLTGAGNRLAMNDTLRREIELAKRHNQPLSILVMDIDNFKQVNDCHGHSAGDLVLQNLISTTQDIYRVTDMVFRYGGEEFVVLLNKTDRTGAKVIAERIRQAVADMHVESKHTNDKNCKNKNKIQATVSIGIATLTGTDSKDSLFDRADKALYKAKAGGRNRVHM